MLQKLKLTLQKIGGFLRLPRKGKKKIIKKDSAQEAMETIHKINERLAKYYEK